ncbi:MAG: glutamate racemase [Lachnospiraceae bacterium]|nr:glutamate racemase [Lachnospiraceae bacterium]
MDKNAPIGVFDSGVGGLTVAREIMRQMPAENIVYFGDTARVPYGSKTPETIVRYTRQILRFLEGKQVKAAVVACNTASALGLPAILAEREAAQACVCADGAEEGKGQAGEACVCEDGRQDGVKTQIPHYLDASFPLLGVLEPGAKVAAAATQRGRIGVIATEATVCSGSYEAAIRRFLPEAKVVSQPGPLLVPLVEEGMLSDPVTEEMVRRYTEGFRAAGVDTLILGCTHYPLLRRVFRRIMGEDVTLVNPAYETAIALKEELASRGLLREAGALGEVPGNAFRSRTAKTAGAPPGGAWAAEMNPAHEFYVSDGAERFVRFAREILPVPVESASVVRIEEY